MKELIIVAKDRVGLLADMSEALGNAGVNIESVDADIAGKNAVIRFVVNDAEKGKAVLKLAGFKSVESDVLILKMEDKPGELAKVARVLSNAHVNMRNVYMIGKEKGIAFVAVQVDDRAKAVKLLKGYL